MTRMNRPAPVEVCYKNMRFLITHNPTNASLSSFIEDLKKYGATTVVRVCEITYDKSPLEKDGITVMDWPFDDGAPPPTKIVDDWLSLLKNKFCEEPGCCVAVHCVAGLGRAPVLVALALIESGMKYEDAIQLIRQQETPGRHQQQAADVLGEVPPQTETAFQRPTQPQKQVLPHVIQSHQPATEGTSHSWTKPD
ncbi:protein tyrosine phosphatase type IVA 3-like isoform X1 [Cyprinus carpio]|uniref:Protein tyrosine phosphatase type IVA 3-like isoform X1 n=1 Tax=Cyprinus carpio TaxID=7962 RepID=A0A9Q9YZJ7_CYPCA|nr:protein tyrosine phosphatase type IVA 3-like isoform X1 [Cyprinus carpio]XP_042628671.1 protein tyrosine phosphatase type IVA 3-like isoform X1 [Cyprinus carpio]XP_042628673.1 protein tyrosine phosphatase type IVA 3-like isoform X1 [Cyprinus carpio]